MPFVCLLTNTLLTVANACSMRRNSALLFIAFVAVIASGVFNMCWYIIVLNLADRSETANQEDFFITIL